MQQEELYREPRLHPSAGHEATDLNPRWIVMFGIGIVIAMGLAVLVTSLLIDTRAHQYAKREIPLSRLAKEREVSPQPRLQVDAPRELREMRAAEDAMLGSYGWVNKDAGIVRIPVERAMDIIAKKGLPARKPAPSGK
jgi:hypothetical protein